MLISDKARGLDRLKYQRLGMPPPLEAVEPPSEEALRRACEVFRAAGLQAF